MATGSEGGSSNMIQATVYIERDTWNWLRHKGLDMQASASAQLVVLAEDYMRSSERRQRDVLRRAALRSRGNSTRARSDDVVGG